MFIVLLVSLLCLYWKARKLSALSLNAQKDKALWMDLTEATYRPTDRMEEEEEEKDN